MIKSLIILDSEGEIIFKKDVLSKVNKDSCVFFWKQVQSASSVADVPPILDTGRDYIVHVQKNGLFFLALIEDEVAPLLVIEFLRHFSDIAEFYYEDLTAASLRKNLINLCEVIEEMIDGGLPFISDMSCLTEIIKPPSFLSQGGMTETITDVPDHMFLPVYWRKHNVTHFQDEIFIDIIEEMNCTVDRNGAVLRSGVNGTIKVKSSLSGMPDLTLRFLHPEILEDASLHPCVRQMPWIKDKIVSFVPPDGPFTLMQYWSTGGLQMPIMIMPELNYSKRDIGIKLHAGTKNIAERDLQGFILILHFSQDVSAAELVPTTGKALYDDQKKTYTWEIGTLSSKSATPILQGKAILRPSAVVEGSDEKICPLTFISAKFKIQQYSVSGLKVDSLKVSSNKSPFKGVKYITTAGNIEIRI